MPLRVQPGETLQLPYFDLVISCRILKKNVKISKIPKKKYTKWFDYDKIKGTLLLRNRCQGDYFVLDSQGKRQKLKKYFINEKVDGKARDQILLLAESDHILWVVGYRVSEAYKVTEETEKILEVQVDGGRIHE